jgi:hypothetical protein
LPRLRQSLVKRLSPHSTLSLVQGVFTMIPGHERQIPQIKQLKVLDFVK